MGGEKMKKLRAEGCFILFAVFFLSACLLAACDSCNAPECTGEGEAPQTATISGKVLALMIDLSTPVVPGATVELEDGSKSTTADENGHWSLEDVPVTDVDPLLKITAPDNDEDGEPDYPTAFNAFPLTLGITEYDLQTIDPLIYNLLIQGAGADPDTACLVIGAVVGFIDFNYPQQIQPLAGAVVSVSPSSLTVVYINDVGMPDPSMTETGSQGSFAVVIPDANAITSISLSGTRPGSQLIGAPSMPTRPGAFVLGGLIDLLYQP